jgi:hypothetical protein
MRHKNGDYHVSERVARGSTQHEFAQVRVTITAHHEQISFLPDRLLSE